MSDLTELSEKIAAGITESYEKIEDGESVEDAKARMAEGQKAREEKQKSRYR